MSTTCSNPPRDEFLLTYRCCFGRQVKEVGIKESNVFFQEVTTDHVRLADTVSGRTPSNQTASLTPFSFSKFGW
jgi:hypothetical protein